MHDWRAPTWLGGSGGLGGNLQTIWPALFSRVALDAPVLLTGRLERWVAPDQDFVDVDWLAEPATPESPLLVLFHGLEGSSRSHYAQAFGHWAWERGWGCAVPHFRGCSGELNLAPRFYHSGDHAEIDWLLARFAQVHPSGPRVAVGVSLGGNVLLRWAQESGHQGRALVRAVAAVSSPLDLAAAGHAIRRGFNRVVYNRMFMASMKPKALAKLRHFPGLYDEATLLRARDLYEYDNVVTAPLHGFASTEDYWARCSAGPRLKGLTGIPALVLNALNDPFVPAASLPGPQDVSSWVTLWQPPQGGHVGFPAGAWPGHVGAMPEAVGAWLAGHL